MSVVVAMGKFTPVQTEYAIKENLPRGTANITAHIVVGTPGTMIELLRKKIIDVSELKVFVLDEADNMLDQDGLGDQTLRVKKYHPSSFVFIVLIVFPVARYAGVGIRSSSSPQHSRTTSVHSQANLPPTQIRSSSRERNSP
jgi:superfamily II DNA/RNA helicase